MEKEKIVEELLQATEQHGLIVTLHAVFGKNIKIRVPFSKKSCDMSIDDICFSPRANNSLKRSGIFTVGEIINLIEDDELIRIRNLGKKTQNEIKTRILAFGYDNLNLTEKKRFFYDLLESNCA